MVVYTVWTCWRCGASYASFWQTWAGVVVVYRVSNLQHVVTEVRLDEPVVCTICGGALEVSLPYAVRTEDGDWLELDITQVEHAMAN